MKNLYSVSSRLSLLFPSSLLIGAAIISGLYLYNQSNCRKYHSRVKMEQEKEKNNEAKAMAQYFFNARKNNLTGQMDYNAMVNAESKIASMESKGSHRVAGGLNLSWTGMGPSNVGGRTRSILVDNQDPSGNTLFAAAVSGGIWKSVNGGATWDSINDNLASLATCDLAQDASGNIYCGTGEGYLLYSEGEGFSSAIIGGGIFKSNNDGKSFYHIPTTTPAPNSNGSWAFTNRIAISPCNPLVVYAATNTGLLVTGDTGIRWSPAYNAATHKKLNGNVHDVKVSKDGLVVIASISGAGYVCHPTCSSPYDSMFSAIKTTGVGKLPTGERIEFAIAPTNSNYIYASVVNVNGALIGVYMSMNGGTYWYLIGPGGSISFDPYSVGGGDQGTYDNTLAVSPANSGELLCGGTTLWAWNQRFATDTVGYWTSLTTYGGYPGDPYHIHPDEHAITFDPNHPNTVYVGCDGGIYKSLDGGYQWAPMNRNYNVTQFYALAFAPYVDPIHGEGILGGTQDNGTPYVNGGMYYYEDMIADLSSGDGGGAAISYIDPNIFFTCTDGGGSFNRGSNLSGAAFPNSIYTSMVGLDKGANMDSICAGTGCFVLPIALYENISDPYTVDSIMWISDTTLGAGNIVHPISPNGNVPYPYTLPVSVNKGDTIKVKNTVVSKVATGFPNSVWVTMQAADLSGAVIWMPIAYGSSSKPDAFGGGDPPHCMTWTPDGDALFVGTEYGQLFRFSNLDSIRDTSYVTGGVMSIKKGNGAVVNNPLCKVISKNLNAALPAGFSGRDVLSISVDPYDGNKVMVTVGDYGNVNYVCYSSNALSASPTFTSKQGNLPSMPVYSSVLGLYNSGHPNSALVGTEHGVYSTLDITAASPTWTPENGGAPNTLVLAMKQQTLPPWMCNNSGNIYMGTHGRGAWYSGSIGPTSVQDLTSSGTVAPALKVYPNPMSTQGSVDYTLATEDNLTLTIYDIQGKEVQNVTLGKQTAGQHLVNVNTSALSNGTYLLTVTGSNFRKTARIVVVK